MRPLRVLAGLFVAAVVFPLGPAGHAEEPATKRAPATTSPAGAGQGERALLAKAEALARRNVELEHENRMLKELVRELESRQAMIVRPPDGGAIQVPNLSGARAVPPHWVPQQFNGETFYVIPLEPGD